MRRVIVIALVALLGVVAAPTTASAQFDLSKVGSLFGGGSKSSKPKKSPYQTLAESAPDKRQLVGTWSYQSVDIEYLGTSSFADAAVSQLKSYGNAELCEAGITPGCFTLTLRTNGKGSIAYEDYLFEGDYIYDPSTARFELTAVADDQSVHCSGYFKFVGEDLVVMINAKDAIDAFVTILPEASTDSTFTMIKGAVDSFPGIYISMHYR